MPALPRPEARLRLAAASALAFLVTVTTLLLITPASAAPVDGAARSHAGDAWRVAATLGLGTEDNAVSCISVSDCVAVEAGHLIATHDGGRHWTAHTDLVPADVSALTDVDCTDVSCFLTGARKDSTSVVLEYAGDALTEIAAPTANPLPTIVCAAGDDCMTTDGTAAYLTRDGGLTWKRHALNQIIYTVPALSCAEGLRYCWVVGDRGETPLIEMSANHGRTWFNQTAPALTDGLYDVACPTSRTCYAVGADFDDDATVIGTDNGGQTWTKRAIPQDYPLRSVSCADVDTCWASGLTPADAPYLLATTDGVSWTYQDLGSTRSGGTPELSCRSLTDCVAVSGGLTFATADAGASWVSTEVPTAVPSPLGVSCATKAVCVGVGNDVLGRPVAIRSTDAARSWTDSALPWSAGVLRAVECPTAWTCLAVSAGNRKHPTALVSHAWRSDDGGATWTEGVLDDRRGVLRSITCPTSSVCLAGGFDERSAPYLVASRDGGASWERVTAPANSFYLDGISCTAADACLVVTAAIGQPPVAWTTDDLGATYTGHAMPDFEYYDAACKGSICVAVGSNFGDAAIVLSRDGGASWKTQQLPPNVQLAGSVSCATSSACVATGFDFSEGGGPLAVGTSNTGRSWRAYPLPARQQEPSDISCVASRCIAPDYSLTGNPIVLAGRV